MRRFAVACSAVIVVLFGTLVPTAEAQQRPRRTEAEARAQAERNREERARHFEETGERVELIYSYADAMVLPVPEDMDVDLSFYAKYVDALGIPVLSSEKVPDDALLVARDIVNGMLAARPDLRASMIRRGWRTGVFAETEMTMDLPEYAHFRCCGRNRSAPVTQEDRDYHANRSRGMGGNPTTGAEENLLGYPGTRYFGEHIFVHEFAHAINERDPRGRSGHARGDPGRVRRGRGGRQVHVRRRPHTLRAHQRRRVLGGGHPVVVLLQLRRVLRGQRRRRLTGAARGV